MSKQAKFTVMIVDDSLFYRQLLLKEMNNQQAFEVIATASNVIEAQELLLKYSPDLMLLDIEMPGMNGIDFLKKFKPSCLTRVVVLSAISDLVFEALQAGALDFVVKPGAKGYSNFGEFIQEIGDKLIQVMRQELDQNSISSQSGEGGDQTIQKGTKHKVIIENIRNLSSEPQDTKGYKPHHPKLIAIGASTGGTIALTTVLGSMPVNSPGIVIVQHMPPGFTKLFAERLNQKFNLHIKEATEGDLILPGHVLIAPGGLQMCVVKEGNQLRVSCYAHEKVNGHCPAVDVLFQSVANQVGHQAMGVLLTGMGRDGASGLLAMRHAGAMTIGQDQATSVVYGMPKVAFEIGAVQEQLPLTAIAERICQVMDI